MKKRQSALEFLMKYGWAILVVLSAIGALAYYEVLFHDRLSANETVLKYMNETDGIKTSGFICYANEGNTVERQSYIMLHELCHRMVDEDSGHFCGDEK